MWILSPKSRRQVKPRDSNERLTAGGDSSPFRELLFDPKML